MLLQSITIILLSLVATQTTHTMDNNPVADTTLSNKHWKSGSVVIDLSSYTKQSTQKLVLQTQNNAYKVPSKISICLLSSFIGLLSTLVSIHCILHHYSPYY